MRYAGYVLGFLTFLIEAGFSHGQPADWKPDRNVEFIVG